MRAENTPTDKLSVLDLPLPDKESCRNSREVIDYITKLEGAISLCSAQIRRLRWRKGKALMVLKELLPADTFTSQIQEWYGKNADRTARRYMSVARRFSEDEVIEKPQRNLLGDISIEKSGRKKKPAQSDPLKNKWKPLTQSIATLRRNAEQFEQKTRLMGEDLTTAAEQELIICKGLDGELQATLNLIAKGVNHLWTIANKLNGDNSKMIKNKLATLIREVKVA